MDVLHGLHHLPNHLTAATGRLRVVGSKPGCVLRQRGRVAHCDTDLLHGRGLLLQRGSRRLGTPGQIHAGSRNFGAGTVQFARAMAYFANQLMQRGVQALHLCDEVSRLVSPPWLRGHAAQITLGQFTQVLADDLHAALVDSVKPHEKISCHQQGSEHSRHRPLQAVHALGLQIIDVNARSDHPPPRFKAFHVRQFFNGVSTARLGPQVRHKTLAVAPDFIDEPAK